MGLVATASRTVFSQFHALRVIAAVLIGGVIALSAVAALQGYDLADIGRFSSHNLIQHLCDDPGAHGTSALPDGKAHLFFNGNRCNQIYGYGNVVAGHHHLYAFRQ